MGTSPRLLRVYMRVAVVVTATFGAQACGPASGTWPTYLPPLPPATFPQYITSEPSDTAPNDSDEPRRSSATPTVTTSAPLPPWEPAATNLAGLASECGNLSYLSVHPRRNIAIAGVAQQGLWVNRNGTTKWTRLGQRRGSATITHRLTSITYDPDDADTFWVSGMYSGGGLYATTDGGATFTRLGKVRHLDSVSVDLADPRRATLLVGGHERRAVLRSSDGGSTWTDITSSLPKAIGITSYPVVLDRSTYLLGTRHEATSGIFITTDSAATWKRVHTGGVSGPPLVGSRDGAIYWLVEDGGLIVSHDHGASWTELPTQGRIGARAGTLVELPDGRLAALGGSTVIVSADGGVNWRSVSAALPFETHGLAYSAPRRSFYIWHFDCSFKTGNPIQPNSIMRVPFDGRDD